jgi:hypothetical protein
MRIYPSPVVVLVNKKPLGRVGTGMPSRERSRICEVPYERRTSSFFHIMVLLMPFRPIRFSPDLMLQDCCAVMAARRQTRIVVLHVIVRGMKS